MPNLQTKHEILIKPAPETQAMLERLATGQATGFGLMIGLLIAGLIYSMTRK